MTPYETYTEERTNPRAYRCPHCESVFGGVTGSWQDDPLFGSGEQFMPCPTCNGTGEVSPQDWDEME